MPFIAFEGVTKVYASGRGELTAVKDLTFTVERGERVAIVGETGCGKSTTISLLLGLTAPTRGGWRSRTPASTRTSSGSADAWRRSSRPIGCCRGRRPSQNVRLPMEILGKREGDVAVSPAQWIARLGLKGFEDAYPHELSGGMRQRVAIARALATEPDLILCDEAFGHLDEVTATELRREFLALATGRSRTLLFITHSIEEAFALGQRVLVMRRPGQVAAELAVPPDATPPSSPKCVRES